MEGVREMVLLTVLLELESTDVGHVVPEDTG